MNVALIHVVGFIGLIILGTLSFFTIFGSGFVGDIDFLALFIPFALSFFWNVGYVWQFLSASSKKSGSNSPAKNWTFISLFVSGLFIVYSLFLTTLLLPIGAIISVFLLIIWFALLFAYTKSKSSLPQNIYGAILLFVSLNLSYFAVAYLMNI